jgi:hypothetical protein
MWSLRLFRFGGQVVIPLPETVTDFELISFADRWAALLEREDYEAAYAFTEHDAYHGWTQELMRQVIKGYGEARADQRVTVAGIASDVVQRKEVDRWEPPNSAGEVGEIWYDLNIDGVASDLTATLRLVRVPGGLIVRLSDIHVM